MLNVLNYYNSTLVVSQLLSWHFSFRQWLSDQCNYCCAGCSRRVQRSFYLTVIYYLFSLPILHRDFRSTKDILFFGLTQCIWAWWSWRRLIWALWSWLLMRFVHVAHCATETKQQLSLRPAPFLKYFFWTWHHDHEEKRTRIEFANQSRIPNVNRDWFIDWWRQSSFLAWLMHAVIWNLERIHRIIHVYSHHLL